MIIYSADPLPSSNSRFGAASFISGSRKNRTRCSFDRVETIRNISVEHIPERALEYTADQETLESVGEIQGTRTLAVART